MKYVYQPPTSDEDFNVENLRGFYEFVFERQRVWYRRFVLQRDRPWTKDEILQKYKYTNVYRELDRGTLWMFENILTTQIMNAQDKLKMGRKARINLLRNVIWKICQYRLLNKVETFDDVGLVSFDKYGKQNHNGFLERIWLRRDSGEKVWTDAHITLQCNLKQDRLKNYETILDRLHINIGDIAEFVESNTNIQEVFERIKQEYGFGPFISYEVVTDLAYIPWLNLNIDDWANPGPGCQFGLKLIWPNMKGQQEFQEGMKWLRDNQEKCFDILELDWQKVCYNNSWLNLRNIEHSLCEFGKYWKQGQNVGRARPIFRQHTFIDMV